MPWAISSLNIIGALKSRNLEGDVKYYSREFGQERVLNEVSKRFFDYLVDFCLIIILDIQDAWLAADGSNLCRPCLTCKVNSPWHMTSATTHQQARQGRRWDFASPPARGSATHQAQQKRSDEQLRCCEVLHRLLSL